MHKKCERNDISRDVVVYYRTSARILMIRVVGVNLQLLMIKNKKSAKISML